jgi:CheY-specific phosphatase CheX
MWAKLDEESVIKANAQFWEQMLMMTLEPLPFSDVFCVKAGHVAGWVDLGGNWKGRIEVRLSDRLAYAATAAMMMAPVEAVAEADALDAAKEIANMIAGTIKSSLPRPCTMSVPESMVEPEEFCALQQTSDTLVVAFRHDAGELMVHIHEKECLG